MRKNIRNLSRALLYSVPVILASTLAEIKHHYSRQREQEQTNQEILEQRTQIYATQTEQKLTDFFTQYEKGEITDLIMMLALLTTYHSTPKTDLQTIPAEYQGDFYDYARFRTRASDIPEDKQLKLMDRIYAHSSRNH